MCEVCVQDFSASKIWPETPDPLPETPSQDRPSSAFFPSPAKTFSLSSLSGGSSR